MNEKHRFKIETKYILQGVFGKIWSHVLVNNCLLLHLFLCNEMSWDWKILKTVTEESQVTKSSCSQNQYWTFTVRKHFSKILGHAFPVETGSSGAGPRYLQCIWVLQSNRPTRCMYGDTYLLYIYICMKKFIIRSWFAQFWRRTSCKTCSQRSGDPGSPWRELRSEAPGRTDVSIWVPRQENTHVPAQHRRPGTSSLSATGGLNSLSSWLEGTPMVGKVICLTRATDSNTNLIQKHPHTPKTTFD